MPRVRALLLWLLMLALPLQGWAAATMVLCALPASQTAHAMDTAKAPMDHAAHEHAAHQQEEDSASAGTQLDSVHKCSSCGACHAAALPSAPLPSDSHPLPQARLAEPLAAHASLAPRALFKPPRA